MKRLKVLLVLCTIAVLQLGSFATLAKAQGVDAQATGTNEAEATTREADQTGTTSTDNQGAAAAEGSNETTSNAAQPTSGEEVAQATAPEVAQKVVVTYYRNYNNNGSDTTSTRLEHQVGERLEGIRIEDEQGINDYGKLSYDWGVHTIGGIPYRRIAWNTAPDGSGTWYRMGHTVTSDMPKELTLYMQWISIFELANVYTKELSKVQPNITLLGGDQNVAEATEHESKEAALDVDYSQYLNYRAVLDFESIREQLRVLWGRLDKVVNNYGYVEARFDKRLVFEDNTKIAFTSTWLEPDPSQFAAYGVSVVETSVSEAGPTYVFEVSKEKLMETIDADGNYLAKLPVKMISKDRLNVLSFEDFMKMMQISVANQYARGINTIVTPESYYNISTSENPYIVVGGRIDLTIEGYIFALGGNGIQTFTINMPKANDEYARLFPHGNIVVNYYENGTKKELVNTNNWHTHTYMGRASHEAYTDAKGNRTDSYTLENLGVAGYKFVYGELLQSDGTRIRTDRSGKVISIINKEGVETAVTMADAIGALGQPQSIQVGDKIDFNYKTSSIINLYFEKEPEPPTPPQKEEVPPADSQPTNPKTPTRRRATSRAPKTADTASIGLSILGLVSSGGLLIGAKKKED